MWCSPIGLVKKCGGFIEKFVVVDGAKKKVSSTRFGKNKGRKQSHYTYTLIESKLLRTLEEQKVSVCFEGSVYYSQRCFECGWVCKSNRKGKEFECKGCGNCLDADLNASCNHTLKLYKLPFGIQSLKLNRTGFYWLEDGLFNSDGEALTVPLSNSKSDMIKISES
jgi:hypothetical protein